MTAHKPADRDASAAPAAPAAFAKLGLHERILRALVECGYETPTPIQARSIPLLMQGKDLLGIAQTGTGKTAAFALPILDYLYTKPKRLEPKRPRALVLAPTRELAGQILESCRDYSKHIGLRHEVMYGGVGMTQQIKAMQKGCDILVATPGRLLDLMQQRHVDLSTVEVLVLDEADRMLDMGFIRDVERVLRALPKDRQSLLFSATMPDDVARLARGYLHEPERVEVTPPAATTERIEQSVCFVDQSMKREALAALLEDPKFYRTLVFTRTKHGADRVVKHLVKEGVKALAIHGNKSQGQRERALQGFRDGSTPVLVATDIAARGIDVPEVTHVVNFDLPNIPESYVHRIGRTARAGREGIAISFCSSDEREYLRDIEKLIRKRVPVAKLDLSGRATLSPATEEESDRRHGKQPQPQPAPRSDWTEIARSLEAEREDEEPRPHGDPFARPKPHSSERPHSGPSRSGPSRSGPSRSGPSRSGPSRGGKPQQGHRGHGGPTPQRSGGPSRPQGGGGGGGSGGYRGGPGGGGGGGGRRGGGGGGGRHGGKSRPRRGR